MLYSLLIRAAHSAALRLLATRYFTIHFPPVLLTAALVVTLAWGAFAFGAVYPWAYIPLAAACAVVGMAGFLPRRGVRLGSLNRSLALALALVAVPIALQLVPLPRPTLVRVSPGTDNFLQRYDLQYAALVRSEALRRTSGPGQTVAAGELPVGEARGAHPISIDPPQTVLALALLAPLALLLLGLGRGLTSRDARRLAAALVAIGVVLALAGIIQRAGGGGKIYGFWLPEAGLREFRAGGGPFGPFVNRNHFAGWMLMALSLGIGYLCALVARAMRGVKPGFRRRLIWFSSSEANRVILVGTGIAVMAIALVMSLSRSGTACLAIALALFGLTVARRQPGRSRRAVVGVYVAFVGVLAVGWVGLDAVADRFALAGRDFAERKAVWQDALHVYRDFPVFGTGVNTFGTAMLVYQTADPEVRYSEAHNDYVQLLSEGGLLVTVPLVIALILFAREVRRRFREDSTDSATWWIRVGAVTGLVAIGLQEIVEFSLQMPGNAALFATLMAIAAGQLPHREQPLRGRQNVEGGMQKEVPLRGIEN